MSNQQESIGIEKKPPKSRKSKIVLSLALLSIGALIAGLLGARATFNQTVTDHQQVSTGVLTIELGAHATQTNALNIAATGVIPGDTIQRAVDVKNTGDVDWASLHLDTVDLEGTPTVLTTDTTNGLQMVIQECSQAWTVDTASPPTYSCGGSTTSVLASAAVIQTNSLLSATANTAGNTAHYRITLTLPSTADSTFETKSADIQYTFKATQRAAGAK